MKFSKVFSKAKNSFFGLSPVCVCDFLAQQCSFGLVFSSSHTGDNPKKEFFALEKTLENFIAVDNI
jgi:hypothetical protein